MRRFNYLVAGVALALGAAALAQVVPGGLPSFPRFQAVGINATAGSTGTLTIGSSSINAAQKVLLATNATNDAVIAATAGTASTCLEGNGTGGVGTCGMPAGKYGIVQSVQPLNFHAPSFQFNEIPVAITSGTFTATLTGMTSATTGTVNYSATNNVCTLWVNSPITGTSNSTALTLTGIPAACTPVSQSRQAICGSMEDNGIGDWVVTFEVGTNGIATIGQIQVSGTHLIVANNNWTASGLKGILNDWTCSYPVQ